MSLDAPYLNCDGCRTTMGRAGCPTHRQNNAVTIAPSTQWSSSEPVITHCRHGLDLRINPRCFLCRPEPTGSFALGGNWPTEHGYTCGECGWGRADQPRSLTEYVAHVNAEHPTGLHRDFEDVP